MVLDPWSSNFFECASPLLRRRWGRGMLNSKRWSPTPRVLLCRSGGGLGICITTWVSLVAQRVMNPPAVWETRVQSLGWEDHLESGMATHSAILTWRIPWTEEPGGLQPLGSQTVPPTERISHVTKFCSCCPTTVIDGSGTASHIFFLHSKRFAKQMNRVNKMSGDQPPLKNALEL